MKKLLLFSIVFLTFISVNHAQEIFGIPSSGSSIVNITVPTDKWEVTNDEGLFSLVPKDSGEEARLIVMIWASTDPTAETAIDDLSKEAFDVVGSLLEDIVWGEEVSDFESNGITFVANDGYGNFKNEDGSKDQMSTSVMLFMPDETNILTLVFFGTAEAYDKWEASLLEVILSITPAN
jgi:hypothetical protein